MPLIRIKTNVTTTKLNFSESPFTLKQFSDKTNFDEIFLVMLNFWDGNNLVTKTSCD